MTSCEEPGVGPSVYSCTLNVVGFGGIFPASRLSNYVRNNVLACVLPIPANVPRAIVGFYFSALNPRYIIMAGLFRLIFSIK